jgi:hypothetical protein
VSVAATSASNVWAVGKTANRTLTLRWDGSRWGHVPSPSQGTSDAPGAVAASSARNAWIVGSFTDGGGFQALAFHCC